MKIITARPENMSFEKYKRARKEQTVRDRKNKKHGVLVYLASQIYEINGIKSIRTYPPAIKTYDRYGNVKYVAK